MNNQTSENHKQLAVRIEASADSSETQIPSTWFEWLPELSAFNFAAVPKALQDFSETAYREVICPTVETIVCESKRLVWDDRGLAGRIEIISAIIGLVFCNGQGAGIAALGTAIGVPLWVVFAAAAAFLVVIFAEIARKQLGPKTA